MRVTVKKKIWWLIKCRKPMKHWLKFVLSFLFIVIVGQSLRQHPISSNCVPKVTEHMSTRFLSGTKPISAHVHCLHCLHLLQRGHSHELIVFGYIDWNSDGWLYIYNIIPFIHQYIFICIVLPWNPLPPCHPLQAAPRSTARCSCRRLRRRPRPWSYRRSRCSSWSRCFRRRGRRRRGGKGETKGG